MRNRIGAPSWFALVLALLAGSTSSCDLQAINADHLNELANPPKIVLTNIAGPVAGGSSQTLAWSLTGLNCSSSELFSIEASQDGGSNWSSVATLPAADGPLSARAFAYTWTVPSWNTTRALVRV